MRGNPCGFQYDHHGPIYTHYNFHEVSGMNSKQSCQIHLKPVGKEDYRLLLQKDQ